MTWHSASLKHLQQASVRPLFANAQENEANAHNLLLKGRPFIMRAQGNGKQKKVACRTQ